MSYKVTIGPRGTVTIPAKVRKAYGLEKDDQLIVEETSEGLLLKPTLNIPIEIYTEERIAEFSEDEEKVGNILRDRTE
jgi:AbrB family looped-hinge helix DNA binding protein